MVWEYLKFNGEKIVHAPVNDLDGKITGKCILNLACWFDENPEERIRLGWIKVLDDGAPEFDEQTQLLSVRTARIDDYTAQKVYTVIDKSEDMMLFDELAELGNVRGIVMNLVTH